MLELTLTHEEREAFDWVGNRYMTGNAVAQQLIQCMSEDKNWDDEGDITFQIPESVAWEIRECCEQEGGVWPCFGGDLENKMYKLLEQVV